MKIAIIIVRTLLGLLFLFASLTYLFNMIQPPELTGSVKVFMDGMMATGYMMTLVKITELVCGLAFVCGFFVPLALVVIAPVAINIFMFHVFVDPTGLPVAVFVVASVAFLAYGHREKFTPLFSFK